MDEAERKARQAAYMREYAKRGANGPCVVDGCERGMYGRSGLCPMHYQRRRTLGEVGESAARFLHADPVERWWQFVVRCADDECWPWLGSLNDSGYGVFPVKGRPGNSAHRWAYEHFVGPIPKGLQLDHTCHTRDLSCPGGDSCSHRRCVNPRHGEPVTQLENIRRGQNTRKTVCKRGHDLTDPANLKPVKSGKRQCRACINLGRMERYYRNKGR